MPTPALAVLIRLLRTLRVNYVAGLAPVIRDFRLMPVERVEAHFQCIREAVYVSSWVQDLPRLNAGAALARFQDHHEGV